MSLHSRPTRLCNSCRHDLLSLFEFGFNGPRIVSSRRSLLPKTRTGTGLSRRSQTRGFLSTQRTFQHDDPPENTVPRAALPNDEEPDSPNQEQIELQALQQIEKELGRPLDEAIREDELAALDTEQDVADDPDNISADYMVEEAIDQVHALRDTDASTEEVVREARSLFGEYLPDGTLDKNETKMYVRLYGEPIESDMIPEEFDESEADLMADQNAPILLDADGEVLEKFIAEKTLAESDEIVLDGVETSSGTAAYRPFSDEATARAQDIANQLGGELYQPDESFRDEDEDANEDESTDPKAHPLTAMGKFATSPRTVFLNQESFVQPLTELLGDYSNKQLKDMCEKTFGGPGLPDSALTPRSAKTRKPIAIPLDPSQHVMGAMEANAYFTTVVPPTYAAITSVLTETRKRLGSSWLRELLAKPEGPRILDAGAGGAGILAWRDIVAAEWQSLHYQDEDIPEPPQSKAVVLAGSDTIRHRSAALLENTTFIPRLPDYVHSRDGPTIDDDRPVQARKEFDVIIAPHTLFPLKEEWQRKQQVQNLWSLLSPNGGVLILLEKGVHRGFEAVAAARELLLSRYISSPGSETYESELQNALSQEEQITKKDPGMIIAPCTNHTKCPMYTVPGIARGRKDICSFQQRYIRPGFLQRILGATDRNHDEVDFSYISVMKGKDIREAQPESYADVSDPWNLQQTSSATLSEDFPLTTDLPRIVYPPLKRRGHVTIDLCTPAGKIERWTVPKSFGKQAYRDARKSKWGDLWALGAKTQVKRNLQLGTRTEKEQMIKDRMADEAAERKERAEEAALNEIAYAEIESEDIVGRRTREPRIKKSKPSENVAKDIKALGRAASKTNTNATATNEDEPEAINAFLEDWEKEFEAAGKKYPGRKGNKSNESTRAAKKMARMQKAGVEPNLTLPWMQSNRIAGKRRSGRDAERSSA
jgi:ribosomal protein RSM22 (predicted rRNA methylase)